MKGTTLQHPTENGLGSPKAWIVCLTAGLFFFYEFFQLNSFDVLNKIIRDNFALQASQMSVLSSVFLWANLLFLIPAGLLLDHFPVKRVMLSALGVCLAGVACLALGDQVWIFLLGRFLTGVGNACCFLSCVILVSRWFSTKQQGFVMGLMVTLAFVGGMLAHMPFVYLIEQVGWRTALMLDVVMGVIFWVLIYWHVESRAQTLNPHRDGVLASFFIVLRESQTYLAGLYTAFLNLPIMVLCALWGASYLEVVHGVTMLTAAQIISMLFFGSMLGCPLLGWLSDWQGRRKPVMWLGVVGTLVCFLPFWFAGQLSILMLNMTFFGLGFFTSAQVISYPLLAESHSPEHVGEATAVASLIIMGGAACGQLLFGFLMQHNANNVQFIEYSAESFQYAMRMFPVAVLLAGVALRWIREPQCSFLSEYPSRDR
ncbi:MAG: MFS transporter [Gammaproteobacteria bacterium]|nr:MFS transporter [Gammaproteobacteria bacterium]